MGAGGKGEGREGRRKREGRKGRRGGRGGEGRGGKTRGGGRREGRGEREGERGRGGGEMGGGGGGERELGGRKGGGRVRGEGREGKRGGVREKEERGEEGEGEGRGKRGEERREEEGGEERGFREGGEEGRRGEGEREGREREVREGGRRERRVNQKVIEADIVLKKSINDYIQNKEQNSIDEDFQKVSEVVCIVEKSRESNIQNEEQMFVKGTDEEKDEEILNQDVSEVNVLKVIEAEPDSISEKSREDHMVIINKDEDEFNEFKVKKDTSFDFKTFDIPKIDDKEKSAVSVFEDCLTKGLFRQVAEPDNSIISFGNPFRDSRNDMPNHRLDEAPSFSLGPEFDDFSIEEINQTNVNDANITINPNIESGVGFSKTEADCSQKEKQSLDRILKVSFRPESEVDVLKEDIKPEIKDASIRMQPKREASVAWYLKSPFKVRGSALNSNTNTLSQAEVLAADTLFIMDEESDPFEIVYSSSTSNFKITRISLESLAPGLKIDQSVIDAWVDLLNFDERNKSSGSPSRYFFKPILTDHLKIEDYITTEYRLYKFEECINLCDYETKRMLNSDKMFHLMKVCGIMGSVRESMDQLKQLIFSRPDSTEEINSFKDGISEGFEKLDQLIRKQEEILLKKMFMFCGDLQSG
ncbi:hypothetical protein Tco_0199288 [Tanacetum coccineum]